jgi:hypothetical protein
LTECKEALCYRPFYGLDISPSVGYLSRILAGQEYRIRLWHPICLFPWYSFDPHLPLSSKWPVMQTMETTWEDGKSYFGT